MKILRTKLKFEYCLPSGNVLTAENEYGFEEDEDINLGLSNARELLAATIANERPDILEHCLKELGVEYSAASLEKARINFHNTCKEIDTAKLYFLTAKNRLVLLEQAIERAEILEGRGQKTGLPEQYFKLLREILFTAGTEDYAEYMSNLLQEDEPQDSSAEPT
ncbi:MAG: hypothetical protein F6K54_01505 [Okeania sp. SIO3B5]|uniref:hypothetical protein n=1 Tax=Okeania sp. SIO3B5 TaxID=2607811 RepID=UPI0013FF336A|nr:hypothetical protein [Okeania sp. SIO3B5]NEO51878.1 hypothetical protein [Okeania sp. SIO3B5]